MNNLDQLTSIIVTYRTNHDILLDCLNSIHKDVKILIVENSNDAGFKQKFESKFKNVSVILSGKNLGYGGGNNLGIKNSKTNFVFISNPDVIYEKNFFLEIDSYIENKIDFTIMGVSYRDDEYLPYGSFNNKKNKALKELSYNENGLKEVDWITGCSVLINKNKFNLSYFFDDNIFLYFEEIDICRRVKTSGGKVLTSSKLFAKHLGNKGSAATDPDYSIETEMFRNWHWMWSTFYYHKKHYNYFYALVKISGKLVRSFFKMIIYTINYDKKKQTMYYARFLGIINSMMGRKSWYRVKSLFK